LQDKLSLPSLTAIQKTFTDWSSNLVRFNDTVNAIVNEVSGGDGSLYHQIVNKERYDLDRNPEMQWDASVRLDHGDPTLPHAELAFLRNRREKMKRAFARYVGVDESEIDERDIPVIGIAGSGGGYRAMVNTIGSLRGARASGILDITTYVAGISGSCWALGQYYSLAGGNLDRLVDHVKSRIAVPFLDPSSLDLLTTPPTNGHLLSGVLLKSAGGGGVTLVDIYGTLVSRCATICLVVLIDTSDFIFLWAAVSMSLTICQSWTPVTSSFRISGT
jgi:phospholipase A2